VELVRNVVQHAHGFEKEVVPVFVLDALLENVQHVLNRKTE
jgi:hypothetical protein